MGLFIDGTYDKIDLVYNSFRNAATQVVLNESFLPIATKSSDLSEEVELDYIYEPGKEEIIKELIPKSLKTQLYKALRDSVASEHGARMTAMHKATDNAKRFAMIWCCSTTKQDKQRLLPKSWKLLEVQKHLQVKSQITTYIKIPSSLAWDFLLTTVF